MRRIFVAIPLTKIARQFAADQIASLRNEFPHADAGWERPEKLHVTLRFLGACDDRGVSNTVESVGQTAGEFEPFDIVFAGTGVFPSANAPRVAWIGIGAGRLRLNELFAALENRLLNAGFDREVRKFSPHLTIGRFRKRSASKIVAAAHLGREKSEVTMAVSEVGVYESILGPRGSKYKTVALFPLGKKATT